MTSIFALGSKGSMLAFTMKEPSHRPKFADAGEWLRVDIAGALYELLPCPFKHLSVTILRRAKSLLKAICSSHTHIALERRLSDWQYNLENQRVNIWHLCCFPFDRVLSRTFCPIGGRTIIMGKLNTFLILVSMSFFSHPSQAMDYADTGIWSGKQGWFNQKRIFKYQWEPHPSDP